MKTVLCGAVIFFAGVTSGCGGAADGTNENAEKPVVETAQPVTETAQAVPEVAKNSSIDLAGLSNESSKQVEVEKTLSEDPHWIKDLNSGAYVWNPEPQDGESVRWSGGVVNDGGILYAQGSGILTWYRDGQVIQVDEGSFEVGRHNGRFKHTFPSGRVDQSNWEHGEEIR